MKPQKTDKFYWAIVVMLLMAGGVCWKIFLQEYNQQDTVNINRFPRVIGQWQSRDIPISEAEFAMLETRNTFSREYTDKQGRQVFLFVVYSQTNRKVFHPPEICYTGGGATIVQNDKKKIPVKGANPIMVNEFLVEYQAHQQVMYYWFKVGPRFTSNYWIQQILVAAQTFLGSRQGSAMIRIAVPYENEEYRQAYSLAREFLENIYPLLFEYLP